MSGSTLNNQIKKFDNKKAYQLWIMISVSNITDDKKEYFIKIIEKFIYIAMTNFSFDKEFEQFLGTMYINYLKSKLYTARLEEEYFDEDNLLLEESESITIEDTDEDNITLDDKYQIILDGVDEKSDLLETIITILEDSEERKKFIGATYNIIKLPEVLDESLNLIIFKNKKGQIVSSFLSYIASLYKKYLNLSMDDISQIYIKTYFNDENGRIIDDMFYSWLDQNDNDVLNNYVDNMFYLFECHEIPQITSEQMNMSDEDLRNSFDIDEYADQLFSLFEYLKPTTSDSQKRLLSYDEWLDIQTENEYEFGSLISHLYSNYQTYENYMIADLPNDKDHIDKTKGEILDNLYEYKLENDYFAINYSNLVYWDLITYLLENIKIISEDNYYRLIEEIMIFVYMGMQIIGTDKQIKTEKQLAAEKRFAEIMVNKLSLKEKLAAVVLDEDVYKFVLIQYGEYLFGENILKIEEYQEKLLKPEIQEILSRFSNIPYLPAGNQK